MPRARAGYAAPQARIPRSIFEHAHRDGDAMFPPLLGNSLIDEAILELPDNWNGTSRIRLKLFSAWTGAINDISVTIDAGQDDELFNVHTQTVANIVGALVVNEYEYIDITAVFAALIALITSGDLLWFKVTSAIEQAVYLMGVEVQET